MRGLVTRWAVTLAVSAAMIGAWAMRPAMDRMWPGDSRVLAGSAGALQIVATSGAFLAGCPLAPAFSFCDQTPGSTGPTATFNLSAASAVTGLTVKLSAVPGLSANFSAGDFTIESNSCGGSLSGGFCTIGVAFTPLAASKGLREAALTITDSNSSDQATVNFAGRASGLALATPLSQVCSSTFTPGDNAYTFCPQAIHTVSTAQTFTLTAANTVTGVTLALAAVPGLSSEFASGDFTIESTTCASVLTANASCTASIAFTPTATGLRAAQLTATDSTGDSTSVTLAGQPVSGLAIVPETGLLPCSPANSFEFCNTPLGGIGIQPAFTLENTSNVQITGLTIPAATSVGDFKMTKTSCVSTLAAGATCSIFIGFSPQTSGLLQEPLTITDAGPDTATINLAGTGDNFTLQLASSTPTQVDVNQGGTATYGLQIVPDAVFGIEGEKVALQCPATTSLPVDTSCVLAPCPAPITANAAASITATFVTSTRTVIAVQPTGTPGCVGYGPGPVVTGTGGTTTTTTLVVPLSPGNFSGGSGSGGIGGGFASGWTGDATRRLFPAANAWRAPNTHGNDADEILALAALAGLAMIAAAWLFAGPFRGRAPRRAAFIAGLATVAIVAAGCHHASKTIDPETAPGNYAFTVQATATDANGNSFNASRSVQLNLDVVQGNVSTGFGNP